MSYFGISALLAAIDLWLKQRIEKQKPETFPRPLKGTGNRIRLYRNHNDGFPFGFLRQYPEVVRAVPLAMVSALSGMLYYLVQKKGRTAEKIGLAMIIGGGASNLYDRYVRRYVVDYFSIEWGVLKKVVFNLGDIFVFLGSAVLTAAQAKFDRNM